MELLSYSASSLVLYVGNLIDTSLVASSLEGGIEPEPDDLVGQSGRDDPPAHGQDIGVVVRPRHPRRVEIVAERRANAAYLVGGDLLPLTAPADDQTALRLTGGHGTSDLGADVRIIDRFPVVRATIVDLVTELPQHADEMLLQREAGVIGPDRNAHVEL
jgi:hypothetical protein